RRSWTSRAGIWAMWRRPARRWCACRLWRAGCGSNGARRRANPAWWPTTWPKAARATPRAFRNSAPRACWNRRTDMVADSNRCRALWQGALAALTALGACGAHADGLWANCVRDASATGHIYYQYFDPATIFVPRDNQAGEVMGPWLSAANPAAWRCTPLQALREAGSVQFTVQGYPPYVRDGVMDVDGQTYGVYQTNNLRVAYIARWRFIVNGQASDWQPLTINTAGQQTPAASFPITYNDGQPFTVGADVQI